MEHLGRAFVLPDDRRARGEERSAFAARIPQGGAK